MHMADALLSPAVGVTLIAASGAALAVSAKKLADQADDRKVPLMGVLGAFVFAAQMINFTIPGTGSSGHLCGGMLLMMLLGPYAAFITLTSVLVVQALLFADGGILALGSNIWNMGFYACFLGAVIFKLMAGKNPTRLMMSIAAVVGAVVALELGALSVVFETVLSGRSELPLGKFMAVMLGIHLPIGLIEGFVTVAVVNYVYRIRPEIVGENLGLAKAPDKVSYRPVIVSLAIAALLIGSGLAWFASGHPDGLEWSIFKASGSEELEAPEEGIIPALAEFQEKTSLLPDYGFKESEQAEGEVAEEASWPDISAGTSFSGIVGSIIVLLIAGAFGLIMVKLRGRGSTS